MGDAEYIKAKDLEDLCRVMEAYGARASIISGGTNLLPDIRAGTLTPEILVDLEDVADLSQMREDGSALCIGATVPIASLVRDERVSKNFTILASAARQLGNPLTRNRATLGGNLADASPSADTAPPLLALEATVAMVGPGVKSREIPLDHFFTGYRATVLEKGEVIAHIRIPKPHPTAKGSYSKLGLRNASAISVTSVAVMLEMEDRRCRRARLALGAVAPTPIRAYKVENLLEGKVIDEALLDDCSELVKEEISPISDIRASAAYRSVVTAALLVENIKKAMAWEVIR